MVQGFRDLRLISRSMAWRMNERASSSGARSARMRSSVPAAKLVRNFSGHSNFLGISHIRNVDFECIVSHIRLVSNGDAK